MSVALSLQRLKDSVSASDRMPLVFLGHWMTRGTTLVDVSALPRTIHDFYGFPKTPFDQQYPAQGHPDLAREVISLPASHHAEEDDSWGLDHGASDDRDQLTYMNDGFDLGTV